MIISGGFNIYPSDLEAVLREHPAVAEAAVVGVPSERWGETPVAFVVARAGATLDAEAVARMGQRALGKTQRLAELHLVDELPRSAIGKVLKRELRDRYVAADGAPSSGARPTMSATDATPFGASGLKVSPLWLGTMMFGDQTDEAEAARIVAAAREAGSTRSTPRTCTRTASRSASPAG